MYLLTLYTAFGLHVVASGSIIHCDLKKNKGILKTRCWRKYPRVMQQFRKCIRRCFCLSLRWRLKQDSIELKTGKRTGREQIWSRLWMSFFGLLLLGCGILPWRCLAPGHDMCVAGGCKHAVPCQRVLGVSPLHHCKSPVLWQPLFHAKCFWASQNNWMGGLCV